MIGPDGTDGDSYGRGNRTQSGEFRSVNSRLPAPIPRELADDLPPFRLDSSLRVRAAKAAALRDQWIAGRTTRNVILYRDPMHGPIEAWIAIFFEDGRGLLGARGSSFLMALERALRIMGLLN